MQRSTQFKIWTAWSPILVAAVLLVGATGFTALLHPRVSFVPSAFFVLAVILASWRGNILVGTLTGLFAATIRQSMYLRYSGEPWSFEDVINILIFTVMSAALAALMHKLRAQQQNLRQTAEQLRVIFHSVTDYAIFTVEPGGTITSWNEGCRHVFGYNAGEFIGRNFAELFSAEDRSAGAARREMRDAAETGAGEDERWMLRKSGQQFWAFGVMYPMRDDDRGIVGFCKIVRDLTERKKAEIALADAHQHLERRVADRTAALKSSLDGMEELLYTIAHDLRAPNRAITGFAQVLESDYRDRLDETARDYISRITSAARQNDALVRDVLEFGWLVHVQFPEGPVDARRALDAALGELDREVFKRDPKIQVEGNWVPMVGSDALLKQIFSSLLAAAVSHVPPEQRPELRISAQHRNGYLRIELHDNGPGISPDLHAQIFQPFLRLNPKVGPAGTSMAFAIVRKAVERMRGRVGLDSTPGEGNCFWLEFRSAGASALAQ